MTMKSKAAALAAVLVVSISGSANAAERSFEGGTDDPGEVVKIDTKFKKGEPVSVTLFQVKQGQGCGKLKLNDENTNSIPAKVRDDGSFTIKFKFSGDVVFRVDGVFETPDLIVGGYEQVACDGMSDQFSATRDGMPVR